MAPPPPPPPPRVSRTGPVLLTALVAVAGLGLSVFAHSSAVHAHRENTEATLGGECRQAVAEIEARIDVVEGILRSAQGLFQASESVEPGEWRHFVATLGPSLGEHGIAYLKYVHAVEHGRLGEFAQRARTPGGDREAAKTRAYGAAAPRHRVVLYAEPLSHAEEILGKDVGAEPALAAALDRATATNRACLSEPRPLLATERHGWCVVLCLPVFERGPVPATEDARRAAVYGWVCAAVRASQVLGGSSRGALQGIEVSVRDGDVEILRVPGEPPGGDAPARVGPLPVHVGERVWHAEFRPGPSCWGRVPSNAARNALATGLVVTALGAALVWSLATTRSRALVLAHEMSESARRALAEVELQRDRVRGQAEELERARDHALDAARAKSEFLATVSHEIRTPLTGVVGMTSLLLETRLTAEQREFASHVHGSADQLLAIVNDLLDFSKAEAGRMTVEHRTLAVRALCDEAMRTARPLAEAKGLPLVLRIDESAPTHVVGDALRLRQVLVNLLANAVKFSSLGAVRLEVEARERGEKHALLRFRVTDQGIGIEPEHLARLFEPFTQADASTTRKFGGTGLGLAICKRLVELMGGTIGAESRRGEGSTFWFELRLPVGSPEDPTTGDVGVS